MPTLTLLDDAMLRGGRMVPAINRLGGGQIAMAGSQQPWRVVGAESVAKIEKRRVEKKEKKG